MLTPKRPTVALLSVFVALVGCAVPSSPVSVGSALETVHEAFAPEPPYAVSCDGRTYFPENTRYSECQSQNVFILIFRRGDFQYAYTLQDRRVSAVSVANHAITYP